MKNRRLFSLSVTAAFVVQAALGGESIAPSLDVMTFNVRLALAADGPDAWSERKEFACDVIRAAAPDVLGLQEALQEQLDAVLAARPNLAHAGEARDGGQRGEYSAIVFDTTRLESLDSGTFWLSDTPDRPSASWGNRYLRICTWARLRDRAASSAADSATFHVFNTHLDHESDNARVRGVRLIAEHIRERCGIDGRFVLMGDFNADESSEPIRLLTRDDAMGLHLLDTFRVLHPDRRDVGTYHAFTGRDDARKIDYILAPAGLTVLGAEIVRITRHGRYPSDHHPVTATIRFE